MSKSIDERIVQMSFKNDNFQKNVSDTMSSLDKLKASLDMSGAKTKFGELATAANGVKLDNLAAQVDNISSKFSGLQVVALGALATIGSKIVDLGVQWAQNQIGSMTQSARDGFKEYETQINAISTILANTKSKGEDIGSIGLALDELNEYSDKTIYNFTEMVSGIKTLTSAGVGLKDGVAVVKGFANAAALAGVSSEEMARGMEFGLNQAIQKGYLGLQDFTSIQGVMGEQFRNSMLETARVQGIEVDAMIAKNGSFRDSLSEGWATTEIIMETLSKMTGELSDEQLRQMGYNDEQIKGIQEMARTAVNAATKVRSFTQLMGTIQEQLGSGWAKTWQLIVGNSTDAETMFTRISGYVNDLIQPSIDARNAQLELWNTLGGQKALVQSVYNIFDALFSILNPIKKAFSEVFPPKWGETLAKISFAIQDFTAGLILSEKASENLGKIAKIVFTGLKGIVDLVSGAFQIFFAIVGAGFRLIGALVGLVTPLIGWLISIIPPAKDAGEATESFADKITKLINGGIGPLISWLQQLGKGFSDFLTGLDAADKLNKINSAAQDLGKTIAMVWNVLAKGDFTGNPFFAEDSKFVDVLFKIRSGAIAVGEAIGNFFNNIKTSGKTAGDIIGNVWDYLTGIAKDAGPAFANMGKSIEKALSGIQIEHVLAALNTGVLLAVGVGVKKMADSIRGIFDNVGDILGSFTKALDGVTGVLSDMQKKLKADMLLRIAAAIGILAISLAILAGIDPERLASAAVGMGATLGALFVAMKVLDKISEESTSWKDTAKLILIGVVLIQLATAVTILAKAMQIMGQLSWEELLKGLIGLAAAMGALVGAAKMMSNFEDEIIKSAGAMLLMAAAILALAGAVAIFGNMPLDVLIQGGIAVAVALGILTGAAILLNKYAPEMVLSAVGLMAMAAALNMLILPISALGLLPFNILLQGMIAVGLLLGGLVIAAQEMSAIAPQMALAAVGMMAMAVAINLLVAPITILGALDMATLIQGLLSLGIVLWMLVTAANAMTGAIVGAGAMIVMAGAILILSAAIAIIGSMPLEQVIQGIIGIAAGMLIIGAAAAVLGLAAPLLLLGAAGLLIVGAAMLMMAGAVVIFAIGLAMLGPALAIATGGLWAFAQVAPKIAEAVPAFLAIGAGLLVFGVGAAVAGAGIAILGVGLVILGAGLALVGIFGPIGTLALVGFVQALGKLADQMPNLLAFSGVLAVLGAATLVLGAGLTLVGVGGMLALVALIGLVPMGVLITASFMLITTALNKLLDQSDKMAEISVNFTKLVAAITKASSAAGSAAAGFAAMAIATSLMGVSSTATTTAVTAMASAVVVSMALILTATKAMSTGFATSLTAVNTSLTAFKMGLALSVVSIEASAKAMGRSLGSGIQAELSAAQAPLGAAGYSVGKAITDGMANGIRSGQNNVTNAAKQVATASLTASKKTLGVASPSKEYFKIGGFSAEGQALGMLSELGTVTTASEKLGKGAMDALRNTLVGYGGQTMLGIDENPVIKPVYDLSALKADASTINGLLSTPKLEVDGVRNMAVSTRDDIQQTKDASDDDGSDQPPIQFNQYNTSPKALSNAEIYRRTKNQLSVAKGALTTTNA